MTTYTLTVSTNALGFGVISGARVVVERKRTQVTDIFNGRSIGTNSTATNSLGIATILLEPDDGSVYHELKIFDLVGILVYSKIFTMPPQAVAVTALPVQDIISSSATQAVAASVTATAQAVISTAQAAIATAQAVIATDKAVLTAADRVQTGLDVINTAADSVATAADRVQTGLDVISAEAAALAANSSAKVFASTALGIAGTVDGANFSVLSADSQDLIIYLHDGVDATELYRIKTKAYIDALGMDPSSYGSRSGYTHAWLDSTLQLALGINNAGKVIFGNGGDIAADIATINNELNTRPTLDDTSFDRSGYSWAWEDSQGNLAGGIDSAGNLISKGINLTASGGDIAANTADILAIERIITPSGFWWYGDSLSQNGVGPKLAALLGKPVTVGGVGGLTGNAVSVRYGGEVSFFTLANNTIPATTTAVDVTVRTVDPINTQNLTSLTGTLAGVHGSFSSDASTYWRFTRTTAGTAKVIDPATPFIIDVLDQRHYGTNVFWYGRNNVWQVDFNANVKRAIADSIAQIKTVDKRFVVLSVLNWPDEPIGTGRHTAIELLNSELKTMYPRNFVDVLNLLRRSGDGSANDIADADSGIIPRSLRDVNDGHLNNTTGNTVVANRVYEFLIEKGWT